MTDTVERFSNRVENYVKYRPGYPREILAYLAEKAGLTSESVIADVGCGTGISARLFLSNGSTVYGIEPNAAMRAAAMQQLGDFAAFSLIDGTADATKLADASVDLVVAAQAFHWFDPEPTRREWLRILRPGGRIVLIWNERQLDTTPFLIEYEAFLLKYATDYSKVRHENVDALRLNEFFDGEYLAATFANIQVFDLEGLRGRMLSSSYMPAEDDEAFSAMNAELRSLFAKHAENGRINLLYDTNVFVSAT
ncbi:MAG: class I SAM-dependent methyltransferase [Chloracidobacterium sp.]|nr:class I SAM-dependent methyltransferase [Chloracidobacterium sp.]